MEEAAADTSKRNEGRLRFRRLGFGPERNQFSRSLIGEVIGEEVEIMRNARQNTRSRQLRDHATRVQPPKSRGKTPDPVEGEPPSCSTADATATPARELENDGRIQAALDGLLAKSLDRDPKTGRFTHGRVTTGAESHGFFADLAPVKADIVKSIRAQLAADTDDAPPTLLALIDAYAEAHLLRKSTFMQLASRGGPITNKGKVRGLLSAWGSFFDREVRAAEKLGLVRVSRNVNESPREWLMRSPTQPHTE